MDNNNQDSALKFNKVDIFVLEGYENPDTRYISPSLGGVPYSSEMVLELVREYMVHLEEIESLSEPRLQDGIKATVIKILAECKKLLGMYLVVFGISDLEKDYSAIMHLLTGIELRFKNLTNGR